MDFKFLTRKYFEDHDKMMCYQEIDQKYFIINPQKVLAVTYIWLSKYESDPIGAYFSMIKSFVIEDNKVGGIFFDYSCLPQIRKIGHITYDRTEDEEKFFKYCLPKMNDIYSGSLFETLVISLHSNPNSLTRGWPYFELFISHLYKKTKTSLIPRSIEIMMIRDTEFKSFKDFQKVIKVLKTIPDRIMHKCINNLITDVDHKRYSNLSEMRRGDVKGNRLESLAKELPNFKNNIVVTTTDQLILANLKTISNDEQLFIVREIHEDWWNKYNFNYDNQLLQMIKNQITNDIIRHEALVDISLCQLSFEEDRESLRKMIKNINFP
jgi:hypothetical protein